jgi:hypothetical protein
MTSEEFTAGLRAVADLYQQHPELPLPTVQLGLWLTGDKNEVRETLAHIKCTVPGATFTQSDYASSVSADVKGIRLLFSASREVTCRRVVVGKKYIPASSGTFVDDVKWECIEDMGE